MLQLIERALTFKPDRIDHGGLRGRQHTKLRFGNSAGFDLDGVWLPQDSKFAVLFIHGNKHNITKFSEHYDLFQRLQLSCLAFDYPGYGQSAGTPSEEGLYHSAHAAYTHVQQALGYPPSQILIYGFSLGGAVAIELLQHHTAAALITESTFTNSHAMAKHLYPFVPVSGIFPIRFTNDARVQNITIPHLIIHGEQDSIVPVGMAHELHALALPPKELYTIAGAQHTDSVLRGADPLIQKISSFVREHVG
jgi:pimeloyl-ACP methyl ester carboxylesterase